MIVFGDIDLKFERGFVVTWLNCGFKRTSHSYNNLYPFSLCLSFCNFNFLIFWVITVWLLENKPQRTVGVGLIKV